MRGVPLGLTNSIVWSGGPVGDRVLAIEGQARQDLAGLLSEHDGFVAFEGGLRCFGVSSHVFPSLVEWNRPDGWRSAYHYLCEGLYFFGEDVFGNQFAFEGDHVVRFLAETAEREFMADGLEEWLDLLVTDPEEQLSLWLLREWRARNDTLKFSEHLCPKTPFILGGHYEVDNLYALDRTKSMLFKADLAWQTRNLPSGAKVKLTVRD